MILLLVLYVNRILRVGLVHWQQSRRILRIVSPASALTFQCQF